MTKLESMENRRQSEFLSTSARQKFDELDVDGDGHLRKHEVKELADWAWSKFHPGPKRVEAAHASHLGKALMRQLDTSGDGAIDFEEFAAWFNDGCQVVLASQEWEAAELDREESFVRDALRDKFHDVDSDHDPAL